ncbi:MAG: hypothetical protein DRR16_22405 [Candidatus Parabeggiatoa sp. nov. 3]|nr:MAG: hypothetical protein DRQ99_02690 [Gammaproteobacteria bacterium]RKZ81284.1 MAG: hypothetical protein DRR16_22405 [Gammaproteobacteria bacterium]
MNLTNILTEKLPLFINELRCTGYNISTAQFIAVQNVILALAKQGKLPPKLPQFKTLIAPILYHTIKNNKNLVRISIIGCKPSKSLKKYIALTTMRF